PAAAGCGGAGRGLVGAAGGDAGGTEADLRAQRAVGPPAVQNGGHRRHRRPDPGTRGGQRREQLRPVGPAVPDPGGAGHLVAAAPPGGVAADPGRDRRATGSGDRAAVGPDTHAALTRGGGAWVRPMYVASRTGVIVYAEGAGAYRARPRVHP